MPHVTEKPPELNAALVVAARQVLQEIGGWAAAQDVPASTADTVARYVAAREAGGQLHKAAARPQLI